MVEKPQVTCRSCRAPLPDGRGPGRPAAYCSAGCRRVAEYELRRLTRRLERMENRLSDLRTWRDLRYDPPRWDSTAVEREVEHLESRLRAPLAGGDDLPALP